VRWGESGTRCLPAANLRKQITVVVMFNHAHALTPKPPSRTKVAIPARARTFSYSRWRRSQSADRAARERLVLGWTPSPLELAWTV
jgi:hypothetical protein